MIRLDPTDDQLEAAALCTFEAYRPQVRSLAAARRLVTETHAALADGHQEPYWAWSGPGR